VEGISFPIHSELRFEFSWKEIHIFNVDGVSNMIVLEGVYMWEKKNFLHYKVILYTKYSYNIFYKILF